MALCSRQPTPSAEVLRDMLEHAAVEVRHPTPSHLRSVDLVEIHAPGRGLSPGQRNIVVFGRGQFDRSPCGTGTCARMAALFAKEKLRLGEHFQSESIIGTAFSGRLLRETTVGEFPAVTGRAFVTGIQQFILDPADALKHGFLI